jgi:ribonuclease HI
MLDELRQREDFNPALLSFYKQLVQTLVRCFRHAKTDLNSDISKILLRDGTTDDWASNIQPIPQDVEFPQGEGENPFNINLATDGSLKDGGAGGAVIACVKLPYQETSTELGTLPICCFKFCGLQSISRAEAFAILVALHSVDTDVNVRVWTDSLSCIDSINFLLKSIHTTPQEVLVRSVKNFSIFRAIVQRYNERDKAGGRTEIHWVHSHERRPHNRLDQIHNDAADEQANIAREGNVTIPDLSECYNFLPSWFLSRHNDAAIFESRPHSHIVSGVEHTHFHSILNTAAKRASYDPTTRLHTARNILQDSGAINHPYFSSLQRTNPELGLFAFKLLYNSLQTPHNNHILHRDTNYSDMYPTDVCPLCHAPRADMNHIILNCRAIKSKRQVLLWSTANTFSEKFEVPVRSGLIFDWLMCVFHSSGSNNLNNGIVSVQHLTALQAVPGSTYSLNRNGGLYVHKQLLSTFIYPIWKEYNLSLYKSHNSFSQRLKRCHNICPAQKKVQEREHRILKKKNTEDAKTLSNNSNSTCREGADIRLYFHTASNSSGNGNE